MTGDRLKMNIITVVWGDWHINAFLGLNVRTLLAAGNLPALSASYSVIYDIYTRSADTAAISAHENFRRLQTLATVRLHAIAEQLVSEHGASDPIRVHHETWGAAIATARGEGAFVLLMPPDVAWSDGSLRHVADLMRRGRKIIYNFYLRVVSDTFAEEFLEKYGANEPAIGVAARELVRFSMRHIHPLMAAYTRSWENFPDHTEMIIWPVAREGLLVRTLARECFLFDPSIYPLDGRNLVARAAAPGDMEFITDSDALFAISLTPIGKDLDRWLATPKTIDVAWLGYWWLEYDSPINDMTAAAKVRIHDVELTEKKWRQVEFGSDLLIRRAAMYREAYRAWRLVHRLQCRYAAELLAYAIKTGSIRDVTGASGRLVVLAPSDEHLAPIAAQRLAAAPDKAAPTINDLIRAHVAVLADHQPDLETRLAREREVSLIALDGRELRLRATRYRRSLGGTFLVNDALHTFGSLRAGPTWVLRLEGVLS